MTRQETLDTITAKLPELSDNKLKALRLWIEQEDDPFEQQLRKDVEAGKLDRAIAEALAKDEAGETLYLETLCNKAMF